MKAIYLRSPGNLSCEGVDGPGPLAPHEVRLRMTAVGVCGSDMHYFRSGRIGDQVSTQPWILGHECTARVSEVGSQVTQLEVGDSVAVDPLIHCGQCDQCQSGRPHTCRNQAFLGCPGQLPGCMVDELVMPSHCCVRVPPSLSPGASVMAEPFAIALHAMAQLQRSRGIGAEGTHLGILGAGPVGLCVLQAAFLEGPRSVRVSDRLGYRVEMARAMGAHRACVVEAPSTPNCDAALLEGCSEGLHAVFECSGDADALDQALRLLRPGGVLVLVGIPESNRISLDINLLRRKEVTIENVRRQNGCTQLAVDLLSAGTVILDSVVTHQFRAEDSQRAFELVSSYQDGVGKALILFNDAG